MIELVPNYYQQFKCKADKCRHTCCAGWEIDIDPDTLDLYQSMGGPLGKELHDNILSDGNTASFNLVGKEERCPFLNDNNLCRLILERGDEELLCDICHEHPRFYNYHDNMIEKGLGLACEEAARIVLGAREEFTLIPSFPDTDEVPQYTETAYIQRDEDIKIMTDRSLPLSSRIDRVCGPSKLDSVARAKLFSSLEILDPEWQRILEKLAECESHSVHIPPEICYENLIVYYLFRYPMFTGKYALECALLAHDICVSLDESYTLEEVVRRLSVEVEYSDINPGMLADKLGALR